MRNEHKKKKKREGKEGRRCKKNGHLLRLGTQRRKRKLTFTLPSHNLPFLSNLFSLASQFTWPCDGEEGQEMKRRREKSKNRPERRRARIDLRGEEGLVLPGKCLETSYIFSIP